LKADTAPSTLPKVAGKIGCDGSVSDLAVHIERATTMVRAEEEPARGIAESPRVALIIPTYNASRHWQPLYDGIRSQSVSPHQIVVIDSSSTDRTEVDARSAGFTVVRIDGRDFNHGGTRQLAAEYARGADILIYLTQDAVPCDKDAFKHLLAAFEVPEIGAAYGRQLPRSGAKSIESHARLFNYPAVSSVRSWESRQALGFKSIFFSNSFGAYRREALMSVGGFSSDVIFGEDTLVVARLHQAGWKTAYVAEARVQHSHSYSVPEEFRRYFDIGVLHARERWLMEQFGNASGEGRRFVVSELQYLLKHDILRIPSALFRTITKYLGYRIGRLESRLTPRLKYHLGLNRQYWSR
jgi:rhamnosyltransferase